MIVKIGTLGRQNRIAAFRHFPTQSSQPIFRTALAVLSTGIPVTRYFPLLPTVPVIVIMRAPNDATRLARRHLPRIDSQSAQATSSIAERIGQWV